MLRLLGLVKQKYLDALEKRVKALEEKIIAMSARAPGPEETPEVSRIERSGEVCSLNSVESGTINHMSLDGISFILG